jgi:hypothetical protein
LLPFFRKDVIQEETKLFNLGNEGIIMKKEVLTSILFLFFLAAIPYSSAITTYYDTTGYTSVSYNANTDNGQTFNYSGTCQLSMESVNTFTAAAPFVSQLIYYSPDDTQLFLSITPAIQNTNCFSWGKTPLLSVSKNVTSGLYENSIIYTQSANGGYVTTGARYVCPSTSLWTNIIIGNGSDRDKNCPFRNRKASGGVTNLRTLWLSQLITNYNRCGNNINWLAASCTGTSTPLVLYYNANYIFPLNGSGGQMNYSFSGAYIAVTPAGTGSASMDVDLINLDTGTYSLLGSSGLGASGGTFPTVSGTSPLSENGNYLISVHIATTNTVGLTVGSVYPPTMNLNIYTYHANYVCGAYSSCINGTQSRTCYDSNGIATPLIEPRICYVFPQQSIFLGFEQGDSANVWYCNERVYDLITGKCERSPYLSGTIPNQKTRVLPKGWYRGGAYINDTYGNTGWIEDYVDVDISDYYAGDASTLEGSLKLWYIPSKPYLPIWNGTGTNTVVCNSTSEGQIGSTYTRTLNQTFWVSQNITALSPYMTLSFRTKKCAAVMPQTLAYWPCTFSCGLFGNCANSGLCNSTGDDYYTWNGCSQNNPKSTIGLRLRDITLGADLALVAKTVVATDWVGVNSQFWEYNINDMNINHTYEISFSAPPVLGVTDNDAYCVLVDDVNINFRSTSFSCAGSDCSSDVDYDGDGIADYTYVEVTPISGTACSVRTIPYDYRCVPANVSARVRNYLDWCDGTTQHHFNNETGLWETATNNPTCIAEQEAAAQQNSYTTPMTGDIVVNTVANLVAMPIFFSFIISMGIGAYVAKEIKFWQIGVIFSLGLLTVFSLAGLFPIWFLFIVAIFAIAMFAYMMKAPAG